LALREVESGGGASDRNAERVVEGSEVLHNKGRGESRDDMLEERGRGCI
jgi:hypothetical protein